jgi:excisionase family DNA binding protein
MSEYVDIKTAAEILGVSTASIYRYIHIGTLLAVRDRSQNGRPYRIKRSDLLDRGKLLGAHGARSPFTCSASGCSEPVGRNSLCWHHYNERERKLQAARNADAARERCAFRGCRNAAALVGYCKGHYGQVRYNAALEHLLPEEHRAERCLLPHCDDPQYANGVCRTHDTRMSHNGVAKVLQKDIEVKPLVDDLSEQIRLWRILRGDTLETVAERLGVTRERVRQIEAKLGERLKERPHNAIAGSEVRYLQTIEFPIDRLVFSGEKEFV